MPNVSDVQWGLVASLGSDAQRCLVASLGSDAERCLVAPIGSDAQRCLLAPLAATSRVVLSSKRPKENTLTNQIVDLGKPPGKPPGKPLGKLTGKPPGKHIGKPPGKPPGKPHVFKPESCIRSTLMFLALHVFVQILKVPCRAVGGTPDFSQTPSIGAFT
ncbi:hypothetical protein Btru_038681 [Bulinus truncatus]|nr:hypothetical protein Btru_038681 [Bulinus truncatus]